MGAFLVRRIVGMVLVLFAVSVLVFLIFIVVPGGDPATRVAGRQANDQLSANVRHQWGFDRPVYVQYWVMVKKTFTGKLISYTNQTNVIGQIKQGLPATFSLSIGAAIIWLFFGVAVGIVAAVTAGRWSDPFVTLLALICISMAVFCVGVILRSHLSDVRLATVFPRGR